MATSPLDLKALTTLRFFAAIWVLMSHHWDILTGVSWPARCGFTMAGFFEPALAKPADASAELL